MTTCHVSENKTRGTVAVGSGLSFQTESLALHAGSRRFDSHRGHVSERFFRLNRPRYPLQVSSELENSGIRGAVGDCSVTERRRWRPPYQTGKTVHVHAKTTNTTRTDARRRLCAAMIPYRWATRGTSSRELEYIHTLSFQKVRIIFFLIIETIVFLLTHRNVAAGVTGETGDGMAIGRVGWKRGSSGEEGGRCWRNGSTFVLNLRNKMFKPRDGLEVLSVRKCPNIFLFFSDSRLSLFYFEWHNNSPPVPVTPSHNNRNR